MAFRFHRPERLEDASRLEVQLGDDCAFIAGGTDLVIQMDRGQRSPGHVIDISRLQGMSDISIEDGVVTIGALVSHRKIEFCKALPENTGAIRCASRQVGGAQVRHLATVGGNIANASPAADLVPPLMVLDAEIVLRSTGQSRQIPLNGFMLAPRRTDRRPGELIAAVRFAIPPRNGATAFLKAGRRKAMEIAVVNVAAYLSLADDGTVETARIALGSVAPTAIRATEAEAALVGTRPGEAELRDAARLAARNCAPIADVRASAEYRRILVAALVERALADCIERIGVSDTALAAIYAAGKMSDQHSLRGNQCRSSS